MVRTTHADGPEQEAARAVLSLLRLSAGGRLDLPPAVAEVTARWRDLIQAEVGDPVRADVVRLVGDGLFVVTLTGGAPARGRVDELVAHLLGGVVSAPLLAGILGLALLDAVNPARILGVALDPAAARQAPAGHGRRVRAWRLTDRPRRGRGALPRRPCGRGRPGRRAGVGLPRGVRTGGPRAAAVRPAAVAARTGGGRSRCRRG